MTCIVGVEQDGKVWMGSDSAASDGHVIYVVDSPKLITNGPITFGYTSSFRFADLLKFKLKFPAQKKAQDDRDYLVGVVVEKIRESLKEGGYARVDSHRDSGGTALMSYRGMLYKLQDDFSVLRCVDQYASCGSGTEFAMGSLFTTHGDARFPPSERVKMALQAAAKHCCTVQGPEHIIQTP